MHNREEECVSPSEGGNERRNDAERFETDIDIDKLGRLCSMYGRRLPVYNRWVSAGKHSHTAAWEVSDRRRNLQSKCPRT